MSTEPRESVDPIDDPAQWTAVAADPATSAADLMWVAALSNDLAVLAAVVDHPNATDGTVEQAMQKALAIDPHGSGPVEHWTMGLRTARAQKALVAADVEVREWWVAKSPNMHPDVLDELADHPAWQIRYRVARHPSARPATLEALARDSSEPIREAVASNASTPAAALARLATGGLGARRGVAANRSADAATLRLLAEDEDVRVRWRVAANFSSEPDTLRSLARDRDENVRRNLAAHRDTPPDVLTRLARSTIERIVIQVAANPSTPPEVRARLAKHKSAQVQSAADLAIESERGERDA